VTQCFACLTVNVLPLLSVLRVWDSFLCEGSKILFRVSLALLKSHQDEILQQSDCTKLHTFMYSFSKRVVDATQLMQLAFDDQPPPVFAGWSPVASLKVRLRKGRRLSASIVEFRKEEHDETPKLKPPPEHPKLSRSRSTPANFTGKPSAMANLRRGLSSLQSEIKGALTPRVSSAPQQQPPKIDDSPDLVAEWEEEDNVVTCRMSDLDSNSDKGADSPSGSWLKRRLSEDGDKPTDEESTHSEQVPVHTKSPEHSVLDFIDMRYSARASITKPAGAPPAKRLTVSGTTLHRVPR